MGAAAASSMARRERLDDELQAAKAEWMSRCVARADWYEHRASHQLQPAEFDATLDWLNTRVEQAAAALEQARAAYTTAELGPYSAETLGLRVVSA